MKEGFWSGLYEHVIFWSGWVFTVGGAIAGLLIGREYAWVSVLCVIVGLVALFTFAFQKHRRLVECKKEHDEEISKRDDEIKVVLERAIEAERKLNAIPADMLDRLHETIRRHSFADVARVLSDYAGYIERMTKLRTADELPIRLKTFVKRGGVLYVEANLKKDALAHLQDDDFFVLVFKDANGLVSRSGHLLIHQREPTKELVWFRVGRLLGDEMIHVDSLAEKQEVPAKNYFANIEVDLAQYTDFSAAEIAQYVHRLASDFARNQE